MFRATTTNNDAATVRRTPKNGEPFQPRQAVHWRMVVKSNKKLTLHLLNLMDSQTGATVMHILRKEYESTKPTSHWYYTCPQIEEVVLSPLCIGDLEAQDYPRQVLIDSSTPRPDLTEAFHNPSVLRGTEILRLNEQFSISSGLGQNVMPHRAILIKTAVSKYIIIWVLTLVILLSIGTGMVVGFSAHSVTLGLSTCAGVIGISAFVQAFLFGMKLISRAG